MALFNLLKSHFKMTGNIGNNDFPWIIHINKHLKYLTSSDK